MGRGTMLDTRKSGPARTSLSCMARCKSAGMSSAKNAVGHFSTASVIRSDTSPSPEPESFGGEILEPDGAADPVGDEDRVEIRGDPSAGATFHVHHWGGS